MFSRPTFKGKRIDSWHSLTYQGPLHQHGCKGAATTIFLTAVSVAGCKDAASTNFLTAVSVAGCKGAAIAIFLTAVSRAGCKGAASTDFLDFGMFLVHFWLPGGPWNGLGDLRGSPVLRDP